MPLLFSVISRGNTILAKHAGCVGNFEQVVDQVLAKISPENARLTYSHGSYLFHYVSDNRIIYMCISDDDFERSKAFAFLADIKRKFEIQYGDRVHTALPFAMNSEFAHTLNAQMRHYNNDSPSPDRVVAVQEQVDELKGIMVRNIDNIASRGERLELLVDKTEDLSSSSITFKKSSQNLARSMWWKNVKITIFIIVVAIIVIYIIVSIACGGLGWQKCVKKG